VVVFYSSKTISFTLELVVSLFIFPIPYVSAIFLDEELERKFPRSNPSCNTNATKATTATYSNTSYYTSI